MKDFNLHDYKQDDYLLKLDNYLTDLGYRKYKQNHSNETFAYWKGFDSKYQVGLLVYDFTEYLDRISITFECSILDIKDRCDLIFTKKVELSEFEQISNNFYNSFTKTIINNCPTCKSNDLFKIKLEHIKCRNCNNTFERGC